MGIHFPETLLRIRYRYVFRKSLNLENPQNLNEKILWAKLYADTTLWTELADKRMVRNYIEKIGLGDILVELYATWYKKEEVDFDALPDNFIIKANNGDGKGTNKIIRKSILTNEKKNEYVNLIGEWLARKNIGALHAEPHYKNMIPCVIAEEVLPLEPGSKSLIDYKIWCFNGRASYIFVCNDRIANGSSASVMVYDLDWVAHPEFSVFNSDYLRGDIIQKPKNFQRMIEIAEKIAEGFPQLRVDLYNLNGNIYFGEMTFTSQGGFMDYFTPEFNKELGAKFSINDFKKRS